MNRTYKVSFSPAVDNCKADALAYSYGGHISYFVPNSKEGFDSVIIADIAEDDAPFFESECKSMSDVVEYSDITVWVTA